MADEPVRYRSGEEDSGRWLEFDFRPDDIVISTRSKSGTTWLQMICALLIFESPNLPKPLAELSPWLDWLILPKEQLFADLRSQQHRRFIKTHTPLDGLPLHDGVTHIVAARHPLDAAVSLYHQGQNINRERLSELLGDPALAASRTSPPLDEWLRAWVNSEATANKQLDSFNGVFHHLTDAWERRHDANVLLVHYADLLHDLPGEMRRIANQLDIDISEERLDTLAISATFESMKNRSEHLAPDPASVLKDPASFFRKGTSGAGEYALGPEGVARYLERAERAAPAELLEWLHR